MDLVLSQSIKGKVMIRLIILFICKARSEITNNMYRAVGVGKVSQNGYTTKFFIQAIDAHPMFTSSTVTMSAISNLVDAVIVESAVSILAPVSETVTTNSYANQTESYSIATSSTSDVYFQLNQQSFSVIENYSAQFAPDLS